MGARAAEAVEVEHLARLWHDGWQDAHARVVPHELTRFRTLESFTSRMRDALANVRVMGPVGAPLGFYLLKGDELDQFYVAASARGTGLADALIADAEMFLRDNGVETAWLACAIGNERAARFYEKSGWRRARTVVSRLAIPSGILPLEVWRYEKTLHGV